MKSTAGKIIGFGLIGIGSADLIMGTTSTPLPILGSVLTQQLDFVLIASGIVVLVFF